MISHSPPLPEFPYYRDPIGGGSIGESDERCAGCERVRGFICTCVAYGADVPDDAEFCPWCVADGTAHARFGATFNEVPPGVPTAARDAVENRTPGFSTWQDWEWPAHCNDVGVYLGTPDAEELRANPEAYEALAAELREWGLDAEEPVDGIGDSVVAYLFECRHCRRQLIRCDTD